MSSGPLVGKSVSQSVSSSVRPSVRLSVSQSVCPSVSQSVRPSVRPPVRPSVSQSVRQSVSPSVSQSVRQSVRPSVRQSVSPSVGQSSLIPVILTGRLGTKTPVVNTKWPWHLSILPWLPGSPLIVQVCVPRVVQKSTSTNLSRGVYVIKPASRKTMVSNTKNIEVCDGQTRSTQMRNVLNVLYIQTLQLEGKAGTFNAT